MTKLSARDYKQAWLTVWNTLADRLEWMSEYPFDHAIINPFTGKPGRHRFDWALPVYMIAVEIDGGQWLPHGGRHGSDIDRQKLDIATALGWRVFRFSVQMLSEHPGVCVSLVKQAIQLPPCPLQG